MKLLVSLRLLYGLNFNLYLITFDVVRISFITALDAISKPININVDLALTRLGLIKYYSFGILMGPNIIPSNFIRDLKALYQ